MKPDDIFSRLYPPMPADNRYAENYKEEMDKRVLQLYSVWAKDNLEKQIEGTPINRNSNQGWVKWGLKNDYPNLLLNLYPQITSGYESINSIGEVIYEENIERNNKILPLSDMLPQCLPDYIIQPHVFWYLLL